MMSPGYPKPLFKTINETDWHPWAFLGIPGHPWAGGIVAQNAHSPLLQSHLETTREKQISK